MLAPPQGKVIPLLSSSSSGRKLDEAGRTEGTDRKHYRVVKVQRGGKLDQK